MKCRYCNVALSPLRSLTDGEFCCDNHRRAFENVAPRTESLERAEFPDGSVVRATRVQAPEECLPSATGSAEDLHAIAQNLSAFDFQPAQVVHSQGAPAPRTGVSETTSTAQLTAALAESGQIALEPDMLRPSGPAFEPGAVEGGNFATGPNSVAAEADHDDPVLEEGEDSKRPGGELRRMLLLKF